MKTSTRSQGSHAHHSHHTPDVLRDWLKDYKVLRPSDLPAYVARIRKDERLCDVIHSVIENALPSSTTTTSSSGGSASPHDYDGGGGGTPTTATTTTDPGLLSSLCHQLFQFYRHSSTSDDGSGNPDDVDASSSSERTSSFPLRNFTLRFVPVLVETYLFACYIARGEASSSDGGGVVDVTPVETLLLSIYNLDVTYPDGRPKSSSFVLPSLARHSVYHDPTSLISSVALTESELSRLERPNSKRITYGPFPYAEAFNARYCDNEILLLGNHYNVHVSVRSRISL